MKQGIQTDFPHKALRESGCYFFCLLRWAEIATDAGLTNEQIIGFYHYYVNRGVMESDCFIIDPVAILNSLCRCLIGSAVTRAESPPRAATYIACLKKPGHWHFVLSHNGETWDPLDPERPGVSDYKIDSYRVIA